MKIGLCGFTIGLAEYLETFAGVETYAMFNNIPRVADARRFAALL